MFTHQLVLQLAGRSSFRHVGGVLFITTQSSSSSQAPPIRLDTLTDVLEAIAGDLIKHTVIAEGITMLTVPVTLWCEAEMLGIAEQRTKNGALKKQTDL
jgi:hypothetical protein